MSKNNNFISKFQDSPKKLKMKSDLKEQQKTELSSVHTAESIKRKK